MQIITLGLCKPSCLCIVNCEKECFNIVWRMYFKALNIGWYPNFTHTTTAFCSRLWLKYHSDSKETKKEEDFFCCFFFFRLPKECVWNYSQAAFMHLATTAAGSETLHRLLGRPIYTFFFGDHAFLKLHNMLGKICASASKMFWIQRRHNRSVHQFH